MESRGNVNLKHNGHDIGVECYGATLHWGPFWPFNGYEKTTQVRDQQLVHPWNQSGSLDRSSLKLLGHSKGLFDPVFKITVSQAVLSTMISILSQSTGTETTCLSNLTEMKF